MPLFPPREKSVVFLAGKHCVFPRREAQQFPRHAVGGYPEEANQYKYAIFDPRNHC